MPVLRFGTTPSSGSILLADNGLTKVGTTVELGGTLIHDTTVDQAGFDLFFTNGNVSLFSFTPVPGVQIAGVSYTDASVEARTGVDYDGGTGTAFLDTLDIPTGNQATIAATTSMGSIRFIDFATDPTNANHIKVQATGIEMGGNKNDASINTTWVGWDGIINPTLATIFNNGDWQWDLYPNTRDDTATFAPTSFLYTGAGGEVYAAPIGGAFGGWALTGNAGTTAGTNFLGTTDDVALVFKIDNSFAGTITKTAGNTAFGYLALSDVALTGPGNSAYGKNALIAVTTGDENVAVGIDALAALIIGTGNVAVGAGAGGLITGDYNVAVGVAALNSCTSSENVAIGKLTAATLVTGTNNVFVGNNSDCAAAGTTDCVALGNSAVSATNGIALGFGAVSATNEFAIGSQTQVKFLLNTPAIGDVLTASTVTGEADWQPQAASSGTDTPTLTNDANITASSVNNDTLFTQIVDPATGETIVTAQYSILINPTVTLTLTQITVTLPVASNPSADLAGQGAFADNNAPKAAAVAPIDGTHCQISFVPVATGSNYLLSFSITYRAN